MMLIAQIETGQRVNRPDKKYVRINAQINAIKAQFAENKIDVRTFLSALSDVLAEPTRLSL
jgi:hypothetical protein